MPSRRALRVPTQAVHDDRGGRDRAVPPARLLRPARLGRRLRLPVRSDPLVGGRLHRHERGRPLQRPHRGSCPRRAPARVQGRVPRRLGDGAPRRRARAPRSRRLLLDPHRLAEPHPGFRGPRPARTSVRRLADLGVRPSRRGDLHEGGGRRRRPRREDRGRDPGGRSAQPGRDRRQRGRQRRRLRRYGRRPVRDVRGDRGRGDAPRRSAFVGTELWLFPLALGGISVARVGDRHVLHAGREGAERDHQRALPERAGGDGALRRRFHPGDLAYDDGPGSASGTCTARL